MILLITPVFARSTKLPIGSMYGIFTYIWLIFMINVGKYTIHGSYGLWQTLVWMVTCKNKKSSNISARTRVTSSLLLSAPPKKDHVSFFLAKEKQEQLQKLCSKEGKAEYQVQLWSRSRSWWWVGTDGTRNGRPFKKHEFSGAFIVSFKMFQEITFEKSRWRFCRSRTHVQYFDWWKMIIWPDWVWFKKSYYFTSNSYLTCGFLTGSYAGCDVHSVWIWLLAWTSCVAALSGRNPMSHVVCFSFLLIGRDFFCWLQLGNGHIKIELESDISIAVDGQKK